MAYLGEPRKTLDLCRIRCTIQGDNSISNLFVLSDSGSEILLLELCNVSLRIKNTLFLFKKFKIVV